MASEKEKAVDILAVVLEKIHAPDFTLMAAMKTILDSALEMTDGDMGTILLKDDEHNALRLVAMSGGIPTQGQETHNYTIDSGIQGRVARTGHPNIVPDVSTDKDYIEFLENAQSEIAIPIKTKGEVIGALSVESSKRDNFKDSDVDLLIVLANQTASAINISKFYGLEEIRRIEKEILAKETCFVIMPFSDPFNKYYQAIICPAIEAAGLLPVRADSLFGPANIMQDIWKGIKKAKLLVAELTTRNPNVMYELGLAHAMEKAVVLLTQNVEDVPFDLRSIRCIVYDTTDPNWAESLRVNLTRHINTVIKESKETKRFSLLNNDT